LQGLQDVFGLDGSAAQHLLDNLPVVVKHAAPANEAQNYLQLLRGIGAEVELSPAAAPGVPVRSPGGPPPAPPEALRPVGARPPPPPPPRVASSTAGARVAPPVPGKAPPPPTAAAVPEALPRPIMRPITKDLEYEMSGSPGLGAPVPIAAREPSEEPESGEDKPQSGAGAARAVRAEFEFDHANASERLELDLGSDAGAAQPRAAGPAVTNSRAPSEAAQVSQRARTSRAAGARGAGAKQSRVPAADRSRPESASGSSEPTTLAERVPGPAMSRAAVVDQTARAQRDPSQRTYALLRVLAAFTIAALGIWFDNSIAYGNANSLSVLAHAVAIYQLGLGLRGLTP
jgi:hypothetical protein